MASAHVLDDDTAGLDSLLNCVICTDPYTNPKVLPCQHTFCQNCLQRTYDYNYSQRLTVIGQFACPTCRTIVRIPRNGIEGLPNDFKIGQIRDFLQKLSISTKNTEEGGVCSVCKFEGEAMSPEFYCVQCTKHLCQNCAEQHGQNPLFKTHTTISIESDNVKSLECKEHQEEIKFVCLACSDLLCTICVLGKHAKHHVKDLTAASEKQQDAVSSQLAVLQSRLQQFEDKADQLDQLKKTKELIFRENQMMIEEQGKVLIDQILDKQQQMISELEHQHQASMEILEREEETTDIRIGNLSSLSDFASSMREPGQSFKLMAMYTHLVSRMEKMAATECKSIPKKACQVHKFTSKHDLSLGDLQVVHLKRNKLVSEHASMSQLQAPPTPVPLTRRSRSQVMDQSDSDSQAEEAFDMAEIGFVRSSMNSGMQAMWEIDNGSGTLTLRHSALLADGPCETAQVFSPTTTQLLWKKIGLHGARDVTFLPDMSLVITESKNRSDHLKLFDHDGNLIRHATGSRRNWMKPWGVTYNHQMSLITITDQKNLTVKTLDEEFTVRHGLKCMLSKPSGIAISRNNNFIITDTSEHKQCVNIYTPEGERISSWGSPGSSNYQFNNPEYIATDHNGRIIISDNLNHCVKIFDEDGNFIRRFRNLGSSNRPITNPEGVCVDAHNNILVAHGDNISMFSPEGTFLTNLEMTDIQRRFLSFLRDDRFYGIAVHKRGLLAVTTDSTLYVYRVPILKGPKE